MIYHNYIELKGSEMHWRITAKYLQTKIKVTLENFTSGIETSFTIDYDEEIYPVIHRVSIFLLNAEIMKWIRLSGDWATNLDLRDFGDYVLGGFIYEGCLYPDIKEFAQFSSLLIERTYKGG